MGSPALNSSDSCNSWVCITPFVCVFLYFLLDGWTARYQWTPIFHTLLYVSILGTGKPLLMSQSLTMRTVAMFLICKTSENKTWGFCFVIVVLFLFSRVFCMHLLMCTTHVPGVLEGQKRVSHALKLEL